MLPRIVYLLAGFLLAAAAAEAVLHAFPYSTGYGQRSINPQNPIALGTSYRQYTYSRDWSFHFANSGILNNRGFRAPYDYMPDPNAVAVIGNSFVQADQLTTDKRMTERLGSLLGRRAYALGIDGFSLVDYLAGSRWAVAEFGSRTVLVLLTTEDLVRSCERRTGQHYLRYSNGEISMRLVNRPEPSLIKRLLNGSSLFRYLFDNLHAPANWVRGWKRDNHAPAATPLVPRAASETASDEGQAGAGAAAQNGPAPPGPPPAPGVAAPTATGCGSAQFQSAATGYLLTAFHDLETRTGARVIFVLAPDYWQRHTARAGTLGAIRDVDIFAERAAQSGLDVVSLEEAFATASRDGSALSLMPIDRHWNALANDVAARTIADFIRERLGETAAR